MFAVLKQLNQTKSGNENRFGPKLNHGKMYIMTSSFFKNVRHAEPVRFKIKTFKYIGF